MAAETKSLSKDEIAAGVSTIRPVQEQTSIATNAANDEKERAKKPWWHPVLEPGHAVQIIIAAAVAIGIGLGVTSGVGQDNIPEAVPAIIGIPGNLWLRALQALGEHSYLVKLRTSCL